VSIVPIRYTRRAFAARQASEGTPLASSVCSGKMDYTAAAAAVRQHKGNKVVRKIQACVKVGAKGWHGGGGARADVLCSARSNCPEMRVLASCRSVQCACELDK